jgi:DinB family protein
MSHRSEQLAKRIEEGAAGLAAFAQGLSDAEWQLRVSATDRRTLGVVIHHVASMYPIEIEVVRAIAGGNAALEVTPEMIDEINANHAAEHPRPAKTETLELLRRNSRAAANAVRALTDGELDQAAPFGLSFGAPVTAQFVIEDHPLRHSWHHLARMRAAVDAKARSVKVPPGVIWEMACFNHASVPVGG